MWVLLYVIGTAPARGESLGEQETPPTRGITTVYNTDCSQSMNRKAYDALVSRGTTAPAHRRITVYSTTEAEERQNVCSASWYTHTSYCAMS